MVNEEQQMRLNSLSPAPGSTKARKRVGRGIGSGSGKTTLLEKTILALKGKLPVSVIERDSL